MTSANDNGVHLQRLDPTQIDVVLGSARAAKAPKASGQGGVGGWVWLAAALAVACWGLMTRDNDTPPPPHATVGPASEPQPAPSIEVHAQASTQVVNQATVVIINAPTRPAAARAEAAPEPPAPAQPQGLVSAQYLAQFKAGAGRPGSTASRPVQIATVTIREWDGPNRYVAKWRIEDNVIDQSSVCFNFPGDSIEHRECRRAAQQYFRNQCKDWTRRAEKARDKDTREARGQFCEVAQGFAP